MLRKLAFALVAVTALGAAALTPTSASAGHGWHGGWHHGWHHGWGGPRFVVGGFDGGCYVRRLVSTPWGLRWRTMNRCY